MLKISDKKYKVFIIKMLQQAVTNTLKTDDKIESLSNEILKKVIKKIKTIKKNKGNFRTEKRILKKNTQWIDSTAEGRRKKKESVNLKKEQQKSPNLNNMEKID